MRMGEDDRIDLARLKRKWIAVMFLMLWVALNQPAIHENMVLAYPQEITRTRDFAGSSIEMNIHANTLFVVFLLSTTACRIILALRCHQEMTTYIIPMPRPMHVQRRTFVP